MNIGINGMGRIGRSFFRVLEQNGKLSLLKAVNDIMPKEHLAYLLQYDTVRGKLPSTVTITPDGINVEGHSIKVFQCNDPAQIRWKHAGVETVIESSGVFANSESMHKHISSGAERCLLTTTGPSDVPLFILGVNEDEYNNEAIFSIGSCTVNGTAPVVHSLQEYQPRSIYLNIIHSYSTRQNILDSYHPELRRSRGSADNIIPLNINLDVSLQRLFPALKNRIVSITSRVPVPCGVLADCTFQFNNPPRASDELKEKLRQKSMEAPIIMEYSTAPLVSSDVINNTHSLVIDNEFVHSMGDHTKVLVWFDNEWGFSNRIFDWIKRLSK